MKMNSRQMGVAASLLLVAVTVQAEGWRFSAGPAWRSRVKIGIRGAASVPTVAPSREVVYDKPDPTEVAYSPADVTEMRPDPGGLALPGDELWAISRTRTTTTVTPGDGAAALDATDTRGPLGLKARLGCDVWAAGPVSVALDLRFAGYWNVRSSVAGHAAGGTRETNTRTDWYLFTNGPYPNEPPPGNRDFEFVDMTVLELDPNGTETTVTEALPGHHVGARLKADLYQIGLGPTVSWRICPRLDAYAGAAALCNIAALDFTCNGTSVSETQCRLGFAGEAGLMAHLTDSLGLYAEVGYEWIDGFDANVGGVCAEADFSSLVVSAGLVFRF